MNEDANRVSCPQRSFALRVVVTFTNFDEDFVKGTSPSIMPSIRFGKRSIKLPQNRWLRVGIGGAFLTGGLFSFLPVLGIWMIPVGLIVLSHDFPRIRRFRRRWDVRIARRWARFRAGRAATPAE